MTSEAIKLELTWWIDNIGSSFSTISHFNPEMTIYTDASLLGWGAVCDNLSTQGKFLPEELQKYERNINALELLAVKYGLQCFSDVIEGKHILIKCDNTTAISYITNMGGTHSYICNEIAREVWLWCILHNVWLSITHVPGKGNRSADFQSRNFNDRTEWELNPSVFQGIITIFGEPKIDLFASYLNAKVQQYYSWKPDPGAMHIDAFTVSWHGCLTYCFPPFSLLGKCLQKIAMDHAEAIVVMPMWPTQPYYSKAIGMLVQQPILLPKTLDLLRLPCNPNSQHPLLPKLQLLACKLSGDHLKVRAFMESQQTLSSLPGALGLRNNIQHTSTSGSSTVVRNKLIHFTHL